MARTVSRLGSVVLGIYLLLVGANALLGLTFSGFSLLLGVLALVAGVLLLVGR